MTAMMPFLASPCLVLILLFSLLTRATSHFVDPSVSAFPIRPSEESVTRAVRLPSPSTTTCTFSYTTQPATVDTTKSVRFDMAAWLSSMEGRGECASTTSNYWEYEVCMLSGVKQFKQSESYAMGRERTVKAETILFTNGDRCSTQDCHKTQTQHSHSHVTLLHHVSPSPHPVSLPVSDRHLFRPGPS
jgi:hypothetical protein